MTNSIWFWCSIVAGFLLLAGLFRLEAKGIKSLRWEWIRFGVCLAGSLFLIGWEILKQVDSEKRLHFHWNQTLIVLIILFVSCLLSKPKPKKSN